MIDKRIKFRHIQSFVEIAREGSLKTAAEKLFLTQPAISKTLKELEEIIGTTLMQRSRSGVTLTRQGEAFLHFAQMSLASLQQGLDGVEREGAALRERITVGALPSVAAWLMPRVATEFAALSPHASLRIMDGPHGYLLERLRLGELDLVIGRMGQSDVMQGISFTQLYGEEVVVVVRPGHPLLADPVLDRIADYPVIYPPEGAAIRPLVERFLISHGIGTLPRRLETVSGAFGRVHTRRSDAVWFISSGVVAKEVAEGTLIRLPLDMQLTRGPVGLMVRAQDPMRSIRRLFEMAVQAAIADPL